ncbi:MAG: M15 family metallopeptidase [Bacillota bacterium]|nr:M15 family metallopeptidase [Bacillota bacterium]
MKKSVLIVGCLFLLSGCQQLDPLMKKIPFLNHQEAKKEKFQTDKQADVKKTLDAGEKENGVTTANDSSSLSLELSADHFNQVKQVDGKNVIQNPANILALVNKQFALPGTYIPSDLVRPKVPFPFGDEKQEKSYMRKEAADALEKMFLEAKKSGIEFYAMSGYRSYVRQNGLFQAEITHVGKDKAEQAVAIPGESEHQTGLAMDISSPSVHLQLTQAFGDTKDGKWAYENAHKFGFILRYPKGKEKVTIYEYEPWHFRYVGVEAATAIYEHKWTLEEYFNEVKKI